MQRGNDKPEWLESGELIYSRQHLQQSFGFRDREVGKAVLLEDAEQGASPIQGKDRKMLKWTCSCGSCVDVFCA